VAIIYQVHFDLPENPIFVSRVISAAVNEGLQLEHQLSADAISSDSYAKDPNMKSGSYVGITIASEPIILITEVEAVS